MGNVKNNTVLAATDFHDVADYAIEHAAEIAKKFDYKLCVAHVYKKKKATLTTEEVIDKLKAIISKIKQKHQIEAEYIFTEGDPLYTINEISDDIGANYLVIGTRGKTGVEYVFGSYTAKILQNSEIPVMVVKNRHDKIDYKNIVLPLDHSVESRQKAKWAILFAKRWNAKLHMFTESLENNSHKNALISNIKLFSKIFEENNINYEKHICSDSKSDFGKEAINFSVQIKADLIIATTKLNILIPAKFSIGLFGSTVDEEFIKKSSQIPYLCINPKNLNVIIGGL